ncbi:NnrU family protein [Jhaorihella thermophila]|uniref:Uncharacterized membrane protein n=1 Tax=Jhaorihella thermophila TaxID=488547 RepID=A0A1H5V612_9RHOB|nr:NnrU family protein [Jhaorihella thermophila]SEF82188.1 Uncharacterized membrane protein [Jhaorihella thermophila]
MEDWFGFAAALAAFLLSHAIPVRPPVRHWLVKRLSLRGYLFAYSALSLGLLWWLIVEAARAPYVEIIPPHEALRWVPLLTMPAVCFLVVAGMARQNPLSFGGIGTKPFSPDRPGLLAFSRHPLPLAIMLWSIAHMLANGDLAHVILFGLFALFSGAAMHMIDRRKQREMGQTEWQRLSRNTALLSLRGLRRMSVSPLQVVAAALVFAGLLWLHPVVIGVSPMP